ncbi:MAG TPA: helix-turn-helix transcriptional regulator [Cellulomonas sp.]
MEYAHLSTVDEVVGYLRDGISVNLVGVRGSGRSHVARLVGDRLRESGYTVLASAGIAALRDRPLAALAVAGVDVPSAVGPTTISRAVTALSKLMAVRHAALLVDDADDLDPVSAGAIAAAHLRRPFPVLTVTRPAGQRRPAGGSLSTELQPGVRVEPEPLRFDELHRIVHHLLRGPVEASVVARAATLSGGLPGPLRAIIDCGRRTGRIREEGGIWRAEAELWNDRLAQVVEHLLIDVDDDDLDALTRLSLAGTVGADEARALVGDRVLARLGDQGVVHVVDTGSGPVVGVFPPLVGEYLRRLRRFLPRLEPVAGAGGLAGAVTGGAPGQQTAGAALTGSEASILSRRVMDHWLAETASRQAAWTAKPVAANAVPLLVALHAASAGPSQIEAVIDATQRDGADPGSEARLDGWHALYRALAWNDAAGARDLVRERQAQLPRFAGYLRSHEAHFQFLTEAVPGPEMLRPPAANEDPVAAEGLDGVRLEVLLAAGRTVDAADLLARYRPAEPVFAHHREICEGLQRVLHGDLDEGIERARQQLSHAQETFDPGAIQAHAYVAALGLLLAGRLDELDALLGPVLTLTGATVLREQYQVGILTLAARAAAWRGREDYGRSLATQARALAARSGPFPAMLPDITVAFTEQRSDQPAAAGALWAAADDRFARGYDAAGIFAAVAAVELSADPERAATVSAHARATQSPLLVVLGELVAATAAGDVDALASVGTRLRLMGATLYAVRAAVTRALVLRERGDIDASARQAAEAWSAAEALGQEGAGLFVRLGRALELSARECEIAAMAVDGLTGNEIAGALSLSVRTVENHLFSAYRKLGATGRREFVDAVSTWAAGGAARPSE